MKAHVAEISHGKRKQGSVIERKQNCLCNARCIYDDISWCAPIKVIASWILNLAGYFSLFLFFYVCRQKCGQILNAVNTRRLYAVAFPSGEQRPISSADTGDPLSTSCLPLTSLHPGTSWICVPFMKFPDVETDVILNYTYHRVKLTKARMLS